MIGNKEDTSIIRVVVPKPSKGSSTGLGLKPNAGYVIVSSINANSIFCNTKLRVGMAIVSVEGVRCAHASASFVAQQLKAAGGGDITLEVKEISALEKMEAGQMESSEDTFSFTTVVLQKKTKNTSTGLSISQKTTKDGKTFPIVGSLAPGSLAASTKLQTGMRLLTLNGIPCRTQEQTTLRLQNATGKVQIRAGSHRMIIVSAPKPTAGSKFGIRMGKKNGQDVVVTAVDRSGSFYETGIEVGMKVLKVNGKNVRNMEMKDVLGILSNCQHKVMILAESLAPPQNSLAVAMPGVPPGVEPGGQWGTGKYQGPCNALVFCLIFPISWLIGGCTLCFKMDRKAMYLSLDGKVYDRDGGLQGQRFDTSLGFRANPLGARDVPQEDPTSPAEQCCGSGSETKLYTMGVCCALIIGVTFFALRLILISMEDDY